MARSTMVQYTSDKSGEEIPHGTGARVRVMFYDPDKIDMRGDLTDAEVAKLVKDYGLGSVEPRPQRAGEKRKRLSL
jgi:hypothetical protein